MKLNLAQIQDPVLRENLRLLQDYLRSAIQFDGFRFFSLNLPAATPSGQPAQIAHDLGVAPLDIVVTSQIGSGVASFLYSKFDSQFIYISSTGPVSVRGLMGTFQKTPGI